MNKKYNTQIGEKYNKWTVIGLEICHTNIANKKVRLIPCKCECGKKSNIEIWKLINKKVKFCNSCSKLGYIPWNKNKKGVMPIPWNKGIKWFEFSGENHPRYIKDRTKLSHNEKKHLDSRYKEWMLCVKNRDHWKCKINNSECNGQLEAHHILGWKSYPELRFDINNGITLCHKHHPRKRNDEIELSSYFNKLVAEM
jgi:hypothetical protein